LQATNHTWNNGLDYLLEIKHKHNVLGTALMFRNALPESVRMTWSKASNDSLYVRVSNIDQEDLTVLILQLDFTINVVQTTTTRQPKQHAD
jgi:endonuclease/exonuclease/phosphatase (EEP) superfamily protein YafD